MTHPCNRTDRAPRRALFPALAVGLLIGLPSCAVTAAFFALQVSLIEQTGSFLTVDLATPWFAALKQEDWAEVYPEADAEAMAEVCGAHPYGDRRIELVLQGCGLDRVRQLRHCFGPLLAHFPEPETCSLSPHPRPVMV